MERRQHLQQMAMEQLDGHTCREIKLIPTLHSAQASTKKKKKGPYCKAFGMTRRKAREITPRYKHRQSLCEDYLLLKVQDTVATADNWDAGWFKSLGTHKGKVNGLKRQPTEWEDIFAYYHLTKC